MFEYGPVVAPAGLDAGAVSVAIVDDHFLFAQALGGIVGDQDGYQVVGIAVTGPQALAIAREKQPHIILLDYHMPGMTADVLLPRIRTIAPDTKVIVLTSDTSETARRSALASGADGFLTKETAVDEVIDAMLTVLKGSARDTAIQALPQQVATRSSAPPPSRPDEDQGRMIRLPGVGSFARAAAFVRRLERQPGVVTAWIAAMEGPDAVVRVRGDADFDLYSAVAQAAEDVRAVLR